jgi:ABC-2 type transport system ATP-binding protein
VGELRASGVTIILTTHYIEEAQAMADRIGVIDHGKIIVVEEKTKLMRKLGKKQLTLSLESSLAELPSGFGEYQLALEDEGRKLIYTFDSTAEHSGIATFMKRLSESGIVFKDLQTKESSLEEIFVGLLGASS